MNDPITLAELSELIHIADDELRAALLLSGYAGLSSMEMTALQWADVDLLGGVVKVGRGLGPDVRTVPLHPAPAQHLALIRAGRDDQAEVFPGPGAVTRLREKLRALEQFIQGRPTCFRDIQRWFFEMTEQASIEIAVFAYLVGNKNARDYVLYTKTGRMKAIPEKNFRRVIECLKSPVRVRA